MGEVGGDPAAIRARASRLRRPLADVFDAMARVEARADAYAGSPSSIHTTYVSVPVQLDAAIPWVRDLAATMDQFADELEEADQRFTTLSRWFIDPLKGFSVSVDRMETGAHVVMTRWWADVWRHMAARLRHWRLQRQLTTASDYLGTGLARPARRALMHDHNRPIRNELARLVRAQHTTHTSVVAGRGGGWLTIQRTVGSIATRFPRTASVARFGGRFLGAAGVALSVGDVVFGVRDGDSTQVVEGVAGLGAVAAFAVGGPVGVAIGVALVAGSLAWRHRDLVARGARAVTAGLGRAASRAASAAGDVVGDLGEAVGGLGASVGGVLGAAAGGGVATVSATVGGWFD